MSTIPYSPVRTSKIDQLEERLGSRSIGTGIHWGTKHVISGYKDNRT